MVIDYVEVGLLARPRRRKSRQRGSDPAIFPAEQRLLFHELNAAKARSPLSRVPHRTVVPVVLQHWLQDDRIVPTYQARRALRTHARNTGVSTDARRRDTMHQVLQQIAHPSATRPQLRQAQFWLRDGERTRNPNWDALADALSLVASPWRAHGVPLVRPIGPANAPMTTDDMVAMWDLKRQVTAQLEAEQISEPVLDAARREFRNRWQDYLRALPALHAQVGSTSPLFTIPEDREQQARDQVDAFVSTLGEQLGLIEGAFKRARVRELRRR
jgi:hypothetical protein